MPDGTGKAKQRLEGSYGQANGEDEEQGHAPHLKEVVIGKGPYDHGDHEGCSLARSLFPTSQQYLAVR